MQRSSSFIAGAVTVVTIAVIFLWAVSFRETIRTVQSTAKEDPRTQALRQQWSTTMDTISRTFTDAQRVFRARFPRTEIPPSVTSRIREKLTTTPSKP